MTAKRPIFLSSVFREGGSKLRLRSRVLDLTGGWSEAAARRRPIWVAEDFREQLHEDFSTLTPLEMAEFCVEGVRETDCFVAVLTERWGSEIDVDGIGKVPTSFLEIELLEAALLQKPSYIFFLKGFTPSPALEQLITILRPAFPGIVMEQLDEDEILRRIEWLVIRVQTPLLRQLALHRPHRRQLVDALFGLRHRPYRINEEPPPIRFLDNLADSTIDPSRANLVEPLLDRARKEPNFQNRLLILWFAIRALMSVPYTAPGNRSFAPLWADVLGEWNSAAAWYGLHGHAAMGCLASLGSLAEIRSSTSLSGPGHELPHGPIASAYYSIAKNAGRAAEIYGLALKHVNAALALDPTNTNVLAIRGSTYLQLRNTDAAIEDYKAVARERKPLEDGTFGEALTELGHALIIAGRAREGLNDLERGVELMKRYPRPGFEIRGIRKLAVGYARTGRFIKALDAAIAAYDKAIESGARDQIHRAERLAKKLEWLRRHKR
jgi:tetratricopeptide (TPR) repeat protein